MRDLKARASRQQLKADFEAYLDGILVLEKETEGLLDEIVGGPA